jgi:hypothetical protein
LKVRPVHLARGRLGVWRQGNAATVAELLTGGIRASAAAAPDLAEQTGAAVTTEASTVGVGVVAVRALHLVAAARCERLLALKARAGQRHAEPDLGLLRAAGCQPTRRLKPRQQEAPKPPCGGSPNPPQRPSPLGALGRTRAGRPRRRPWVHLVAASSLAELGAASWQRCRSANAPSRSLQPGTLLPGHLSQIGPFVA